MSKTSDTKWGTKEKWNKEPQDTMSLQIQQDYANTIVNQLLIADDSASIFNAINKLKFYDAKLKEMGLRATIKVGTQKI